MRVGDLPVCINSKGNRRPEDWLGVHFQVTGDGPLGIGHSGVGVSAIGHRLQVPAADPKFKLLLRSMPACQQIPTARRAVLPKQSRDAFA